MLGPVLRLHQWEHGTNVPKKLGNRSNDDPSTWLPCHLSPARSAAEGSHVVLAQWGPAVPKEEATPSFLPKNPLELLQSPCARPWPPAHIAIPLAPGPGPGWIL